MSSINENIKKNVLDQLYWDDRINAAMINVSVDDGIVTLSGNIPSFRAKNAASSDACTIHGVNSVVNKLKVVFPSTIEVPTDQEIQNNIQTALNLASDIDISNIKVSVNEGIVIVSGSVPSYWQKTRSEHIITGITGVYEIINKLTIVPTKTFLDEDIANDIISALDRNYNVDVDSIDIKIENGIVTLTGEVLDWKAYETTMNTARYTAGVIDIFDHLKIKGNAF